ncbi:MAG: hypothetical protein ACI4FZ_06575, partial [Lachnospiraceae bacterium]
MRKRNNNGTKAIIGLAAASIVVIGASVAISLMDGNSEPVNQGTTTPIPTVSAGNNNNGGNTGVVENNGEALDLTGASSKISAAYRNEDGTYTVVVKEEGYIGTIKLSI